MTSRMHINGFFPDEHTEKIAAHFAHASNADVQEDRETLARVVAELEAFYVICFTNRCGSNHLCQCIASDGRLRPAQEVLNWETVIFHATKHGFRSFEAYLAWLIGRHQGPQKIFGLKAGVGQFIGLYNTGILELLAQRLRVLHIARKDVLAQAVSLYIATRTRQWTSQHPAEAVEVPYDPVALLVIAESIGRQNALFALLFRVMGVTPLSVDYDELVADPAAVLRSVARHLGMPTLQFVSTNLGFQKQADDRNERLLRAMIRDFAIGG